MQVDVILDARNHNQTIKIRHCHDLSLHPSCNQHLDSEMTPSGPLVLINMLLKNKLHTFNIKKEEDETWLTEKHT